MRPLLELLVAPAPAPAAVAVIHQLRRWAEIRAADRGLREPHARFATSATVPGLGRALADADVPLAVWVDTPDDIAQLASDRGPAVLVGPQHLAGVGGDSMVAAPESWIDGRRWPAALPLTRHRRRRRFGFPDDLVVSVGTPDQPPALDDASAVTALGLAAAADVRGPITLGALALATPVVTDSATAAWLGAIDGEHLLVRREGVSRRAAEELAGDQRLAARLGRSGRALVSSRFDIAATAERVATGLRLDRTQMPAVRHLRRRLAELRTPNGALPTVRAVEQLAALGPSTRREVSEWIW